MDCNKCSEILSLYILNEIPQIEADEVSRHLKECESCSKKANELSVLLSQVSTLEVVEPPDDFLEKVTKRAEKELWTSKGKLINYKTFLKIASIAAIFAVSFITFRQLDSFRAKTSNMPAKSAESSTAQYGKAIGSADSSAANNSSAAKADTTNKALQDSGLASQQKDNTAPKIAYDTASGTGNVSRASGSAFSAKDIFPSATPAPEKSNAVDLPKTDGKITNAPNDTSTSEQTAPTVSANTDTSNKPDEKKSAKTVTGNGSVTIATVTSDSLAETQVQVKAKDKAAASQWIRDQAPKFNGVEVAAAAPAKRTDLTTQESIYATPKAITSESVVTNGDKIIIEISKDNAEKFKSSILEHFGKDNVIVKESTVTEDTIRFSIEITE